MSIPGIHSNGYTLTFGGVGVNIPTFCRLMEQSNLTPDTWVDEVFDARVVVRQTEGLLTFKL